MTITKEQACEMVESIPLDVIQVDQVQTGSSRFWRVFTDAQCPECDGHGNVRSHNSHCESCERPHVGKRVILVEYRS